MLHMHELARVAMADREREFRDRTPHAAGVPSGPRHPVAPEPGTALSPLPGSPDAALLAVRRVAFSR
ncbi:MAG: hypothetical protein A2V85_02775 [Chloroflexi bacterium RBG_16_72_14]|nr:MAG: hypothetical protein A2V85_02775 [Chloroflexi bacterium RBG_16_72_14]